MDKNAAYRMAMDALKKHEATLAVSAEQRGKETELRQSKYLDNMVEQDHRNLERIVKPMMELKTFNNARRTLSGIEAMNMIRKGVKQGDSVSKVKFIEAIFEIAA